MRGAGIRISEAPLSVPGIKVAEGDYILDVNGRSVSAPQNLYSFFEGTAGKLTSVRVNSDADNGGLMGHHRQADRRR